jgi:thiol:disulfide interchange protein
MSTMKTVTKTFSIFGFFFAFIALILAFLPLRMFALIPGLFALVLGCISFYIAHKNQFGKKLIYTVLIIAIMGLGIALISQAFNKEEVAKDKQFERKTKRSQKNVEKNDLDSALKDLK